MESESLRATDDAARAVQQTPNRVSLDTIKAKIAAQHHFTLGAALDALRHPKPQDADVLSICVLTMHNGFTVIGKAAPADAANFDPDVGRKFAYEDAIRQIWPLEGYALREKLRPAAP